MKKWDIIRDYIMDNGAGVHKLFYNELQWCMLSDRYGNRIKITEEYSIDQIDLVLSRIISGLSIEEFKNQKPFYAKKRD